MALLLLAPSSNLIWDFDWARDFAIAMYFLSIVIFAFAAHALQPSLRINPIPKPGAPFITHGIYKYLRHPMYFAVMVIATALLIQKLNLFAIFIWIALGANMSLKARYEDQLLRESHTAAQKYQAETAKGI